MTLILSRSKMFDVCELPVLTCGNCVLKTKVIQWPLKLYPKGWAKKICCCTVISQRLDNSHNVKYSIIL